ncbi:DEP domain-containing protein 1B [Heterocephalus glaber]|uniref:DEP domain-containing protein 1B n=1 Tax=Heterocephalus glaber TaxID=10181 RepID=G5BHG5_HETGA|nr:DEP domain-containing protein 1B [Heterocephalus glaber]
MEHRLVGPGPYRATKLQKQNEQQELQSWGQQRWMQHHSRQLASLAIPWAVVFFKGFLIQLTDDLVESVVFFLDAHTGQYLLAVLGIGGRLSLKGASKREMTACWNETVELFRARMPLRKHRCRLKSYECCFTAAEAVDWLHELLRCSQNFGPEVTRKQTVQLLKKFLKNHVIEDIKGKWGQEDFEDNRHLYRFPPSSPLKPYPKKPPYQKDVIKFPGWNDSPADTSQENIPVRPVVMNSEMWFKRHSIAIGEVPACRLVHRRQLTEAHVEEIWKSMTLSYLQKILGLDSLEEVLDIKLVNSKFIIHNVYSVSKQGVVILDDKSSLLQKEKMAVEAFQICCLLLPPENRRKLQLLMRMMARICLNKEMPPLCDGFGTRTLMVQTFSRCILCSKDEVDLDELLAARLVTFLMDNYQEILKVPLALQTSIEERVAHLRRVQDLHPEGPKASGGSQKTCAGGLKDLCRKAEGCILEPGSDAHGEDQSSPDENSSHSQPQRGPKFLPQGETAKFTSGKPSSASFSQKIKRPRSSPPVLFFMAIGNNPQIKYPGADMDITLSAPSFCRQISPEEFEYQRTYGSQEPLAALLEEVITDTKLSSKEKKKKLKQFQKSYPEVYQERFPTPESEALLFSEKPKPKTQLFMWALKNPFQPFQRTRSFRM